MFDFLDKSALVQRIRLELYFHMVILNHEVLKFLNDIFKLVNSKFGISSSNYRLCHWKTSITDIFTPTDAH